MSANLSGTPAAALPAFVGLLLLAAVAETSGAAEAFKAGVIISPPEEWTAEQTAVDFLDIVGLQAKARWRQLYREPPPTPSTERPRAAFTLGGLIADSFLALQAEDAQQFRNRNQDILSYCRVLGLSDKVSPRLMAQRKLAEAGKWADLRQESIDGHQELTRLFREQHDDDLAILVDLGVWLRVLEVSSALMADMEAPGRAGRLSIGSIDLLKDLKQRFSLLSEPARRHESIALIGDLLDFLLRNWAAPANEIPSKEFVSKTHEKLKNLMRKLTLK